MRALVTGASGFVGSHLVEGLVARGARVAILRRASSDLHRLAGVLHAVETIEGDLASIDAACGEIEAFGPDTVFHLAWGAVAGPRRDDSAPAEENLRGTLALLRVAAAVRCRTVVCLGSQAEYAPREGPLAEDAPTDPATWYGLAKRCTHLLARRMAADLGFRLAWIRLFSAYGPGDHPSALIPYLIRSLLAGERPALTTGDPLWDYLYIADAVEAIRLVAETPGAEGIFNLGSGRVHRIRDVARRVRDLIDPGLPLGFGEKPYGPHPIRHLQADVGRLTRATGWAPRTDLDEGLRLTIRWHRRSDPASTSTCSLGEMITR